MKSITTPITWINALTRHVTRETVLLPPWLVVERLKAVDDGTESSEFGNWRVMTFMVGREVVAYLVPTGFELIAATAQEAARGCRS